MKDLDKRNMPLYIIVLSLILIFPLGVYYIVLKTEEKLRNIKKVATNFKIVGFLGILVGVIYFLANYSVYVSLIDSHMNLDMYSFVICPFGIVAKNYCRFKVTKIYSCVFFLKVL